MKHRTLAKGLDVSAIGIGCMPMIREGNINYGQADDDQSIRTLHEAIDLGITFFDTAEMYGPFANEILLGKALKPVRDRVVNVMGCGAPFRDRRRGRLARARPQSGRAAARRRAVGSRQRYLDRETSTPDGWRPRAHGHPPLPGL